MERFAIKDLIAWKNSPRRRPLLVQGARQVGKTWLIREFGQTHFAAVAYVNFLEDEAMARQFEGELAPGEAASTPSPWYQPALTPKTRTLS